MDHEYVLSLSVRAMNVTAVRNGLSQCLIVFEVPSGIPTGTRSLPIQRERMMELSVTRSEMMKDIAKQRLENAKRRHVSRMNDHKERPSNEWVGPTR